MTIFGEGKNWTAKKKRNTIRDALGAINCYTRNANFDARARIRATCKEADFCSISSELKSHEGLPKESLSFDKLLPSKKNDSPLRMAPLKFLAKYQCYMFLLHQYLNKSCQQLHIS